MSQSALSLPIRTLAGARRRGGQWICQRCLATQTNTSLPSVDSPPPPRILKDASDADNYDPTLPSSQRDYRLTKNDFHLKKALPHKLPVQYLQHSTSEILHQTEQAQREQTRKHKRLVGVVVSAGRMEKTVKVKMPGQTWNKKIGKVRHLQPNTLPESMDTNMRLSSLFQHQAHI